MVFTTVFIPFSLAASGGIKLRFPHFSYLYSHNLPPSLFCGGKSLLSCIRVIKKIIPSVKRYYLFILKVSSTFYYFYFDITFFFFFFCCTFSIRNSVLKCIAKSTFSLLFMMFLDRLLRGSLHPSIVSI